MHFGSARRRKSEYLTHFVPRKTGIDYLEINATVRQKPLSGFPVFLNFPVLSVTCWYCAVLSGKNLRLNTYNSLGILKKQCDNATGSFC